MHTTREWKNYSPEFVAGRYNSLAKIYPVFEWIFMLPRGMRHKAVETLRIRKGDNVLEIGCGTGRNLALLSEAVGVNGTVYGIDVSEEMLIRAEMLRERKNLSNLSLACTDASKYTLPEKINSALFSLSYAVMINRMEVLADIWNRLQPGGRVVIMDAQFPPGIAGKIMVPFRPFVTMFLKATVIGNPYIKPVEELHEVTGVKVEVKEMSMKSYFIAVAQKT